MEKTNIKHSSMQSIPLDGVKMRKKWQESYELFVTYQKEYPDTPIRAKTKYHDFNLGQWVRSQRKNKNNKSLSVERIKLLDEAGIIWNVNQEAWEQGYRAFLSYRKENPDTPIPTEIKYNNYNLGNWISTQRGDKKKGTLSAERIKLLEEAGIIWDPFEEAWQQGYKLFVVYKKEFPDVPITQKAEYHGYNLGSWVGKQRTANNKGTLSPERIKLLDETGFVWDLHQETWEAFYRAFVAYKKEFPDTAVPIKAEYHDLNLGSWVSTQRGDKKKGTLSSERVKRLEDVGIIWDAFKELNKIYKQNRVTINCSKCNKDFQLTPSSYKNRVKKNKGGGVFCSKKCWSNNMAQITYLKNLNFCIISMDGLTEDEKKLITLRHIDNLSNAKILKILLNKEIKIRGGEAGKLQTPTIGLVNYIIKSGVTKLRNPKKFIQGKKPKSELIKSGLHVYSKLEKPPLGVSEIIYKKSIYDPVIKWWIRTSENPGNISPKKAVKLGLFKTVDEALQHPSIIKRSIPFRNKMRKMNKKIHHNKKEMFIKDWENGEVWGGNRTVSSPIRKHLLAKYNYTCAVGQVDLDDFDFTPIGKKVLAGKKCGYNGKRATVRKGVMYFDLPNLEVAHLNDNPFDHSVRNILPLCGNHHGEITVPNVNKQKKTGRFSTKKSNNTEQALKTGKRRQPMTHSPTPQEYIAKRRADTNKKLKDPVYKRKTGIKEKPREYIPTSDIWDTVPVVMD